jgi:hypothetical protein
MKSLFGISIHWLITSHASQNTIKLLWMFSHFIFIRLIDIPKWTLLCYYLFKKELLHMFHIHSSFTLLFHPYHGSTNLYMCLYHKSHHHHHNHNHWNNVSFQVNSRYKKKDLFLIYRKILKHEWKWYFYNIKKRKASIREWKMGDIRRLWEWWVCCVSKLDIFLTSQKMPSKNETKVVIIKT